jgi:hypothetical protein
VKASYRGAALLLLQCLLVLSVAGKYAWDRERLPRAWANATPVDPSLPIRGRYVIMQLRVQLADPGNYENRVRLAAENGKLVGHSVTSGGQFVWRRNADTWILAEPVAFFLPEHASDPTRLTPGQELWVEVSVPANGPPRPIRLAIRTDGGLRPLDLQ